jgi:peptide/nickel transport system substrate-binding protein
MSRFLRKLFNGQFIIVALVILSTCVTTGSASAASTHPHRGGTLNIADVGLSWTTLDPALEGANAANTFPILSLIYEGLFTTTPQGIVEPALATSYSYNANRTVLTLNLRKGVKFQDGTPFNSSAVVFNLDRETAASSASSCIAYFTTVTSITTAGTYKVHINFSSPYGPMISELAGQSCFLMVSPTAVETYGVNFGAHPVGTGPYKFVGQILNSSIDYTRFGGYWQHGLQYFNNIVINVINNDQSAIDSLETGGNQVFLGASATDLQEIAGNKSLKVEKGPYNSVVGIRLNLTAAPFKNPIARKALAQAINPEAIAKGLYNNTVKATQSYETSDSYYYDGTSVAGYPKYSPTQAAADAKSIGGLSFTMNIPNVPTNELLADTIQSQLQAAGITVTLNPLDETTVITDFQKKNYQAGMSEGGTGNFPDPDTLYYRNFDSTSPNNQAGLDDPVVDNLVTQARGTVLPINRKKIYERVQEQLTGSGGDFPLIPLFGTRLYAIESVKVQNFPVYASNTLNALSSWLS